MLVFFTYLYAPTVLGIRIAPSKSVLVPTAHDEPAIRLGIYRDVFSSAAAIIWNTEVERKFVTSMFHLRTVVEDVVGCGVDMPEGAATADDDEPPPDTGMGREILAPHLEGPANVFRRRHRIHGPFALYGGRIDPGKGCEELLEYFQTYVKEGGDASLLLMGVKFMPLPDDPHVRFAGVLPDEERMHALEAATVVVVPVAAREPVAPHARGVRRRHARPGQRARRGPRRALPPEQRRPLLRGSLGVRRSAQAADARRAAAARNGPQRQGLRRSALSLEHDHGEVRAAAQPAAWTGEGARTRSGEIVRKAKDRSQTARCR